MRVKKRFFLTLLFFICLIGLTKPVYAEGWKFRSASENAVPWNKEAGELGRAKTGSENSVLKMRISGQAGGDDRQKNDPGKTEDMPVSGNKVDKEKAEKKKSDTGKKSLSEDKIKGKADPDDWRLILVNKQNPIPDDYEAVMVPFRGGVTIREEIKGPLDEMFDAAAKEGITLQACSGYRSHEHQQALFDRKIRTYTGQGLSYLDAFRIGSYSVIIPGTSEHELGMALDIVTPGYTSLNEGFANTGAGRWLKNNAFKYGFILRYPKGKEYITGIIFEPWHYRYVGKEAAVDIRNSDMTLEEYLEELELY